MPKDLLELSCPCCGKRIELNTRTGAVRAVNPQDKRDAKDIDQLLAAQQHESKRLTAAFDDAAADHAAQDERLDKLFRDAREAAQDDTSRPRHPFQDD